LKAFHRLGPLRQGNHVVARLVATSRHRPDRGRAPDRRHRPCGANLPGDPEPYECLGHQVAADASIGIALAPEDGTDLDQLLKNAIWRCMAPRPMDAGPTVSSSRRWTRGEARRTLELDLRQAT